MMTVDEFLAVAKPDTMTHADGRALWVWWRSGSGRTPAEVVQEAARGNLPPDLFDRLFYGGAWVKRYPSEEYAQSDLRSRVTAEGLLLSDVI